jgi:hypothetical protein
MLTRAPIFGAKPVLPVFFEHGRVKVAEKSTFASYEPQLCPDWAAAKAKNCLQRHPEAQKQGKSPEKRSRLAI